MLKKLHPECCLVVAIHILDFGSLTSKLKDAFVEDINGAFLK
jgi:hypothetical protein